MAHLEFDPLRYMGLMDPRREKDPSVYRRPRVAEQRSVLIGDLTVEIRSLASASSIVAAWDDLVRHAAEPNIFHEPAFALAAEQHLPECAGQSVALVWGPRGGKGQRLLALWPMQPARRAAIAPLCRGMKLRYASSGAPLLDHRFAVEAASALISGLSSLEQAGAGLLISEIALDGPVARALRAAATLNDIATSELDVHARACLWPGDANGKSGAEGQDGKARREMNRQLRGLARHGDIRLVTARSPEDVRVAMEAFLAVEASGWKALRGTSILSQTRDASFYRSMTRELSRRGQIAIHVLEAGGRVAAAGLVLSSGCHSWYVKTTYDEALAEHAPGVLLSQQIGQLSMNDPHLALVDSCAVPGHRMIERVWQGRVRIGDLVVAGGPGADRAIAREQARRRTRMIAKRFYYQMRGWPI
ncbi:MAG: GNAT family N-acetyltransferase [Bosea sp. (in: a-proteobacteria)]